MYPRILNIQYCFLFLLFLGAALPAFAVEKQEASFVNVEILPDQMVAGILGIGIRFDVQMKYQGNAVLNKGEQSARYSLQARLFDAYGLDLAGTADAKKFRSETGQCRDSTTLIQGKSQKDFTGETLFIPYYALALLPGKRKLQLELQLRDRRSGEITGISTRQSFFVEKPESRRFRMSMKYIEVTEKDGNGDTWDYYFLNPKEVLADIRWSMRRGEDVVYVGERQKNLMVYVGEVEKDRTEYFTLSQGDLLTLQVVDYDLISFSDEIGTVVLDPWVGPLAQGKLMNLQFGQVTSVRFELESLDEPKMLISSFDLEEMVREDGVTGLRLSLDYKLEYNVLGADFEMKIAEFWGGGEYLPRFARVISGPADRLGPASFKLTSNKGKLVLFLPWYGLQPKQEGKDRPLIRLKGLWKLDGQEFAMGMQQRELLQREGAVLDFIFGQWKAGEADRNGMAGLLFSCEYKLSGHYLADLNEAEIRLYPEMRSQLGPIPVGYLTKVAPKGGQWTDNALIIRPEIDTGRFDLFMPYHQMPEGLKSLDLSLDYRAELSWEGRKTSLGVFRLQQEVSLPAIRKVTLGVREVAAGRNSFLGTQPNFEWRVRIGDKEMYRSRTIMNAKTARWEAEESVTLRLTESDLVKIEIYKVMGAQAQLTSSWEGRLSDFPKGGNGFWKLKLEGLHRILVNVEE